MKLTKVLSSAAVAAVVVLVSVLVVDAVEVQPVNALAACVPGRTSTYSGSTYVEFTTVTAGCTWTVPSGVTSLTEVLIVAGGGGGGGGGRWGGGGGAGEVISLSTVSVGSTVDIAVGGGGSAGGSTCALASNGGNSFLVGGSYSATAFGGGGGGPDNQDTCTAPTGTYISGASGGSGGGSGQSNKKAISNIFASSLAATSTPPGYGNQSGSYTYLVDAGGNRSGTGGGGAGANGGSLVVGGGNGLGGKGGNGTDLFHALISEAHSAASASSIGQYVSSASKYYVAGGGAGASSNYSIAAVGGLGGGGSGSSSNPTNILVNCTNGTAQTGGGGGNRCAGGSGFVLIKYTTTVAMTVTYNSQGGTAVSAGSTTTGGTLASLPTTSRVGYGFDGWFTASSGGSQVTTSSPHGQTADFTLYARWTANSLTVTYDSQEGSSATGGSLSTTTGGTLASLPTTSRVGYGFDGWFTASSGGSQVTTSSPHGQTSSFTLYARWTANPLTVTYDSQEGSSATGGSLSTTTGGTLASLPTTLRVGYGFDGWFTASSGGSQVTSSSPHGQTADFTLFAQWSVNTFVVSFNGNGSTGGSVPANQTKTYGENLTLSPAPRDLLKTGYTFGGWNTAADGSGTSYADGASYGVDAAATLYARWTANSLTVTYDSQEGSSATGGSLSTTTGGTLASLPTTSRVGYGFDGWFTASSGGSQVTTSSPHGQTSSFTLYARWTANPLTVTYDSQEGSSATGGSLSTTTGGTLASLPTTLRVGYGFDGWFTASSGGSQVTSSSPHGQTADFTLFAQWSANSLTVTFDSQGGSSVTADSTTTGGSISASPGTPTRTGYTFTGWFAASTGGSALSFPFLHGQTASFTLFAQWSANSLTVTYDSQGGSAVTADSTTTGSSIAASPGTPTRAGYTFNGWFVASSGGVSISFPYAHGRTSGFTLYTQWSANALTVEYNTQSGSSIASGSTSTGASIIASPGTPTRTGYTFTGWFVASTGGSALSFPYVHNQTASFTLFAQWAQSSLYGLGSTTKIGTITTANGVGNTFAAETATSSVSLRYPADGLPAGTVIDVYLVNDLSRAGSLIDRDGGFVISLVVAWLAADSSVPLTASGKPISMTIANTTIKAGAKTYAIVGGVVTMIGTATSNGSVTVLISEDPEIVVVNPVVEEAPSDGPPDEPVTSPALKPAPVITPIAKLPTGIRNLIPVIPGAPSKISGILNPSKNGSVVAPKVVTPVVNANGKTQRTTIAPVQLRAVPIDAPTAPVGAKIVPIGSMIVASKESPREAESPVALGEAEATFGGQPITSTIQKSSDGVLLVSSGPTRIALAGFSSNSSAGLATSPSVPLEIATNSFIAATPVQVWLFSTPLLLAETTVDADGNFAVAINIPRSVPSGNHMLQIQGYTYTSSGAAEITSNIGISIVQSTGQTWSITFSPYVASISRNNQVAWTRFVSSQGASVFSCSLTGVSPSKNSKANVKLFENRRISLLTMLKYNGCINVNINAPAASTKSSTLDRTWRVDVQPATSSVAFKWSHNFKIYSSAIDQKQISQWIALVAQNESSNMACSVTGVEPLIQSKANTQLFVKRNESLKKFLSGAGCSLVQFDNPISRNEKLGSRTIWKVEVNALN